MLKSNPIHTTALDGKLYPASKSSLRSGPAMWPVYKITRRSDCQAYAHVTANPIAMRMVGQVLIARFRPCTGSSGTVTAAPRTFLLPGLFFESAFTFAILAETQVAAVTSNLKCEWTERPETKAPSGFNIMPGSSLGGPAKAQAIAANLTIDGPLQFTSIMQRVPAINRGRSAGGKSTLSCTNFYARQSMGLPAEDGLQLVPLRDGRREKSPFRWYGKTSVPPGNLTNAEGMKIGTMRSELYVGRKACCDGGHDGGIGVPVVTVRERFHWFGDCKLDLWRVHRVRMLATLLEEQGRRVDPTGPGRHRLARDRHVWAWDAGQERPVDLHRLALPADSNIKGPQ